MIGFWVIYGQPKGVKLGISKIANYDTSWMKDTALQIHNVFSRLKIDTFVIQLERFDAWQGGQRRPLILIRTSHVLCQSVNLSVNMDNANYPMFAAAKLDGKLISLSRKVH